LRSRFPLCSSFLLCLLIGATTIAFAQEPKPTQPPINGDLLATKAFRAAAKRVAPALVTIEAIGLVKEDIQAVGRPATLRATGGVTTGLVLSSDGYILTSTFGLGEKAPAITVILADGSRHLAKELGRDVGRKLCLLKIADVSNLPICEFVAREQLKVGQWVVAVGLGLGEREPSISSGIISATHRIGRRAVQTDANTSPVNYGGPLVDLRGRVVGLCVPLSPGDGGSSVEWYDSGIGFAIPIAGLDSVIDRMKKGETLVPGFMGVLIDPASDEKTGAKVKEVVKDGPAEKAGLKAGDVLSSVEGNEITDGPSLTRVMGEFLAGQKVKLQIVREGEKKEIEVTLGVRPPPPPPMPMPVPMPGTPMPMPPEEKKPEEPPAEKPASEEGPPKE
jgi:serine protease Do